MTDRDDPFPHTDWIKVAATVWVAMVSIVVVSLFAVGVWWKFLSNPQETLEIAGVTVFIFVTLLAIFKATEDT